MNPLNNAFLLLKDPFTIKCISPGYSMFSFEDPSKIVKNYLMLFCSNIRLNSIGILRKWRRKHVSGLQPPTSGVANIL